MNTAFVRHLFLASILTLACAATYGVDAPAKKEALKPGATPPVGSSLSGINAAPVLKKPATQAGTTPSPQITMPPIREPNASVQPQYSGAVKPVANPAARVQHNTPASPGLDVSDIKVNIDNSNPESMEKWMEEVRRRSVSSPELSKTESSAKNPGPIGGQAKPAPVPLAK